jgi:predicted transcriptional regulator
MLAGAPNRWLDGHLTVRHCVRMSVRTNLLLPEDVVEALDRVAGPRGRSRYVAEAVRERVKREERQALLGQIIGAWHDHPLFPTDEAVVEWVRAGRAEETDPGPTGSG